MKVSKWAMLIAIGGGLTAATASAQVGMRQPTAVTQTGFEYGSYYQTSVRQPAASPSDVAPAAPAEAPVVASAPGPGCEAPAGYTAPGCTTGACATDPGCAAAATCGNGCANGCETDCKECAFECPEACEPWRLFQCFNDAHECRGVTMRGWINAGIMGNADTPASNFNGPVTFYDRDGELQLSQAYWLVEKALDTSNGPAFGYRMDLMYGTDSRFNISRGLSARDNFTAKWDSSRFYGLDMPQLYGEVGVNDTSLKVGHFYTLIGYEGVMAPDNFFMTHSYTHQYGEPFTHTGALVSQKVNDQLTLRGGVTFGWDNFEDVYNDLSFIGAASMTASDGNSSLDYAVHVGEEEVTFGTITPNETRFIQSVVYKRTMTDRLRFVAQSDWGNQENANGSGEDAEWYGLNSYLFYNVNCCWTAGLRAEWFRDDDGYRVAAPGDYAALGFSNNPASAGGFAGDFYQVAGGVNYKPASRPNLTVRGEARYDSYDGPVNGLANQPFDDGASDNQFLYGVDVIYLY